LPQVHPKCFIIRFLQQCLYFLPKQLGGRGGQILRDLANTHMVYVITVLQLERFCSAKLAIRFKCFSAVSAPLCCVKHHFCILTACREAAEYHKQVST